MWMWRCVDVDVEMCRCRGGVVEMWMCRCGVIDAAKLCLWLV